MTDPLDDLDEYEEYEDDFGDDVPDCFACPRCDEGALVVGFKPQRFGHPYPVYVCSDCGYESVEATGYDLTRELDESREKENEDGREPIQGGST